MQKLEQRKLETGKTVCAAIRAITEDFNGSLTHDSGHIKSPTWVYTFSDHGNAQLALRINKEKLSVYVRATPQGRTDFEPILAACGEIEERYGPGRDEKPANSLLSEEYAPYLSPRRWQLVRVRVNEGKLPDLLRHYLSDHRGEGAPPLDAAIDARSELTSPAVRRGRTVTPGMLRRSLERNDATGRAGERVAYAEEVARLAALGCPNPSSYVQITAEAEVAAGYDIRSEWNGEVRCIEVKSSTVADSDFFLTANERAALTDLGDRAWLYRVRVDRDGEGHVVQILQNPMSKIPEAALQPVVWRVELQGFDV